MANRVLSRDVILNFEIDEHAAYVTFRGSEKTKSHKQTNMSDGKTNRTSPICFSQESSQQICVI